MSLNRLHLTMEYSEAVCRIRSPSVELRIIPAKNMTFTPGTKLGAYEIVGPLGKGGMGDVYRARDSKLKREVAIKVLPYAFSHDAERVARFQREAEVLASLNHPHIAAIHDLAEFGDSRFLVLELVEGETLAERTARGPIPIDESLAIAKQIAEALEAAHEKGIIHRDLKLANVKITPGGTVKVLDFGLAKVREAEAAANFSNSPTLLSGSTPGMIMGTAAYMSPEQAKGKETDRTTDVWAFGCVLYEMLTGQPIFEGETITEILGGVLKAEPDWNRLPPETPPPIRRLLRRCLQKNRTRRLHDMADARIEIEEADGKPEPNVPVVLSAAYKARERILVSALSLVTLIAAVLAVRVMMHWRETLPDTPTIRSTILPPENTTLDFTNGLGLPALSPDGRRIVFGARTKDGKTPLWVRSLDGLTAQPLAGTEGAAEAGVVMA